MKLHYSLTKYLKCIKNFANIWYVSKKYSLYSNSLHFKGWRWEELSLSKSEIGIVNINY